MPQVAGEMMTPAMRESPAWTARGNVIWVIPLCRKDVDNSESFDHIRSAEALRAERVDSQE